MTRLAFVLLTLAAVLVADVIIARGQSAPPSPPPPLPSSLQSPAPGAPPQPGASPPGGAAVKAPGQPAAAPGSSSSSSGKKFFRWIDKDGVVNYTDSPPQPSAMKGSR